KDMKAKKSRVILSGVSLLLVLCLLVGGTMAWFTDTEKVDTNFTAGILDVSVKPGEEGKTALDFENLRPMLYENFYKELDKNEWNNDVTQGGTTGLKDSHYDPVPAYFKPVEITNEGTLPTKVKLSLEAGNGCADGEPILTDDNITITQDGSKQDCANRLAPVLKVFVYKLVGEDWTLVEGVNLNTAYDEDAANPDGVASENTAEEANSTYMTAMIPANGTERYVIAGYLPETVGNAYQGQHYHGNLVLNAYQMDDTAAGNPDEGGSSSEDPDDPDRFNDNVTIEWRENTADGTLVQSRKVTVKSDTTIAAADYAAPEGYVYSPDAAEQSSAVTVNDETGAASPATVVFTVVEEEAETIEYVLYYQNTVNDQLLTETKTVSLEVPGEYTIATPDWAGRTVTITAPLPEGYVFDPAAQSFNVSVDADGVATPETVTFGVKPEGSGEDPDPEEHPEAYQVRVDFRNAETGALLDQSNSKTYSGLSKAAHTFTPVAEAQTDTATAHYVTAPEGYEYDPATQTAKFVTVPVANGPAVIEFTVKPEATEPTDPEEPENPDDCQLPHIIHNEEELSLVDQHMGHNFVLANDITLERGWKVLGLSSTSAADVPFTGTFDGNNHTISGLHSVQDDYSNIGLFAVNAGTIKDLKVEANQMEGWSEVGTVAGINQAGGVLSNVHVQANYVGALSTGSAGGYAGGLVGRNNGTITGCSATITGSGLTRGVVAYNYAGGLVGGNWGTIEESYAMAGINAGYKSYIDQGRTSAYYAGGFAGGNVGTIRNCYVIATDYIVGVQRVGGFVAFNGSNGQIISSYVVPNNWVYGGQTYTSISIGKNDGSTTNCYAVSTTPGTVNGFNRISSANLQNGTGVSGFDTSIWSFAAGEYPDLINNAR
ncbi:MAG: SipW-dependent-type signal peptide-containing protein, partial [Clostridium sp.]|nr:SipW-dependent-type signal peptide-containing protein [Clostridium sp.]